MIQQCTRWLVPVGDHWFAGATGTRRHYAPSVARAWGQRRDMNYRARCGTGISITRTDRVKAEERWDQFVPCQRCVDSVQSEVAQYESMNRNLYALLGRT